MSDQDWTVVVFKKRTPKKPISKSVTANGPNSAGESYVTVKKSSGGQNTGASSKPQVERTRLRKIAETEIAPLPKISAATRTAIAQGRTAKGLTQKDLAQRLNVKLSVIQDYENGKAVPDNRFLSKIEKLIDVKLQK